MDCAIAESAFGNIDIDALGIDHALASGPLTFDLLEFGPDQPT